MRFFVHYLTVLLLLSHDVNCTSLGDMIGQFAETATGVIESIPRSIPTIDDFFNLGKNAFIGLPFEIAFAAINKFCKFSTNFVHFQSVQC